MSDSMSFLSGSLNGLFSNIKESCQFYFIKQSSLISDSSDNKSEVTSKVNSMKRLSLLLQKGVFPYEWATRLKDFDLPMLVEQKHFFNSITSRNISSEDYQRAQNVWTTFEMKNMKQYMETYCLVDTLLLCEVFERFKDESMKHFEIEPCHFISLPGFAYQAFLKYTDVELDYVTSEEFFDMMNRNIRGGNSFASQRYEESSFFKRDTMNASKCKQQPKAESTERQFLLDIDMNNLVSTY